MQRARVEYIARVGPEEQLKVVELIEAVIAADGVVVEKEREFLLRVIERFRLSAADRADRIVTSDAGRATATLRTLAPDAQVRVMALLVDAAIVDGCIAPEERALLLASAATLGIEAAALEERIARRLKSTPPGAT
jgi:uncharacterized tellurite resistance protein B-like protein